VSEFVAPKPRSPQNPVTALAVPKAVNFVPAVWNRHDVWTAEVPAAGGIMNADAVARVFAMIANGGEIDGHRLLSAEHVCTFPTPRLDAEIADETLGSTVLIGQNGFWVGGVGPLSNPIVGQGHAIAYHAGSGGTIGWADLDTGIAAAILHNRINDEPWDLITHPWGPISEAIRAMATN